MANAQTRVTRARRQANLTQSALAKLVGVHRSAVAQWEKVGGCSPTVSNMSRIAVSTSVQFEWLATGRGRMVFASDLVAEDSPVVLLNYSAHDEVEARALAALRRLKQKDVIAFVEMLEILGCTRSVKLQRAIPRS